MECTAKVDENGVWSNFKGTPVYDSWFQYFQFSDLEANEIYDADEFCSYIHITATWHDGTKTSRDIYDDWNNIDIEEIIFELISERVYQGDMNNFWRAYDGTTLFKKITQMG